MLNKIFLQGRLVADPEMRHTPSGVAVTTLRLAVDRDFKDRETGEKKADFVNVVAWRATAEFVSRYFTKGRMAIVEGRLQMRDWTDSQDKNGAIPDTAPYFFGSRPGTHITSVFVLLPWLLYRFYGDRQIIEEYYEHLKKYVLFNA